MTRHRTVHRSVATKPRHTAIPRRPARSSFTSLLARLNLASLRLRSFTRR